MKLTAYSNYALRLLQLAALRSPGLVREDDVVRVHGPARPHIVKIVHKLGQAGLVETKWGRGGGFRLARPAEEIVVRNVIQLTEGPLYVVECFKPEKNTCPLIGICTLLRVLRETTKAFMAVLDDLTLAVVLNKSELLARLPHIKDGNVVPVRRAR